MFTMYGTVTTERRASGRYLARVALDNGDVRYYSIRRTETLNPSARGGAYRTEWRVSYAGRFIAAKDTLKECPGAALADAIRRFAKDV